MQEKKELILLLRLGLPVRAGTAAVSYRTAVQQSPRSYARRTWALRRSFPPTAQTKVSILRGRWIT